MHPVIGLIGKKRSGKDTLAGALVEAHDYRRLAFADALKKAALAANPIVGYRWKRLRIVPVRLAEVVAAEGWETAKERPEVRGVLQRFGVGLREQDSDVWVRPIRAAIADRTTPVVVTDVRFANEAEMILGMGGRLVRITRPGVDDGDTHESESALPWIECALTLQNEGTISDLVSKVPSVLALYSR